MICLFPNGDQMLHIWNTGPKYVVEEYKSGKINYKQRKEHVHVFIYSEHLKVLVNN